MATLQERLEDARQRVRNLEAKIQQAGREEEATIARQAHDDRERRKAHDREWQWMQHDTNDEHLLEVARQLAYQMGLPRWVAVRMLNCEREIARLHHRVQTLENSHERTTRTG